MTMTPERLAELDAVMAMLGKAPLWKTGQWFERNAADIRAHIDAQAATIARVIGAAKSLLALCEQAGLADDLLATIYPDSKNRSGQTRDETAKQARRTMNEARAALSEDGQ